MYTTYKQPANHQNKNSQSEKLLDMQVVNWRNFKRGFAFKKKKPWELV